MKTLIKPIPITAILSAPSVWTRKDGTTVPLCYMSTSEISKTVITILNTGLNRAFYEPLMSELLTRDN